MPSKLFKRKGHVLVFRPNHPHASKWGYVPRARIICEESLGRILPKGNIFHHINGIPDDDRPDNIIPFQISREHTKYHRDQKALRESGHIEWRKCCFCGLYGDPKSSEWYELPNKNAWHRECKKIYDRRRYERIGIHSHRNHVSL
jgi:hypothetical protein